PEPVITAETFSLDAAPSSTDTAQAVDSVNSLQAASVTSALDVLTRLGEGTITPIIAVELLVALGIARDAAQRMVNAQPEIAPAEVPPELVDDNLDEFENPFAEEAGRRRIGEWKRARPWSKDEVWHHF